MTTTCMTISELRASLGRRVDAAWYRNESTIITSSGEPRAILAPYTEQENLRALGSTEEHQECQCPVAH